MYKKKELGSFEFRPLYDLISLKIYVFFCISFKKLHIYVYNIFFSFHQTVINSFFYVYIYIYAYVCIYICICMKTVLYVYSSKFCDTDSAEIICSITFVAQL